MCGGSLKGCCGATRGRACAAVAACNEQDGLERVSSSSYRTNTTTGAKARKEPKRQLCRDQLLLDITYSWQKRSASTKAAQLSQNQHMRPPSHPSISALNLLLPSLSLTPGNPRHLPPLDTPGGRRHRRHRLISNSPLGTLARKPG